MPTAGHFRHTHRPWTEAERALVRARYRSDGAEALGLQLDRPAEAIKTKAFLMGLCRKRPGGVRAWSPAEDEFLRRTYAAAGPSRLGRALGRTADSVQARAQDRGLTRPRPADADPPA